SGHVAVATNAEASSTVFVATPGCRKPRCQANEFAPTGYVVSRDRDDSVLLRSVLPRVARPVVRAVPSPPHGPCLPDCRTPGCWRRDRSRLVPHRRRRVRGAAHTPV